MLTQHQQFYDIIERSNKPLITFKKDFNGDTIASALAIVNLLEKLGKKAEIVCDGFVLPPHYSFLTKAAEIKQKLNNLKKFTFTLDTTNLKLPKLEHRFENDKLHMVITSEDGEVNAGDMKLVDSQFQYDLIITINTPDFESLGRVYEENTNFFYQTPIINLDHSPDNEHYGQLNFINLTATSVSEIAFELIAKLDEKLLDETIATCLLAGMIDKTKSFKTPNVTPRSLNVASQLIANGAERDFIIKNLYQTKTVSTLRLWGRVLLNLQTSADQKIAWAEIQEMDFTETGANEADLADLIDELIVSIPSVALTAIFYEKNAEKFCILKSEKNHDLRALFQNLSPAGNRTLIKVKIAAGNLPQILATLQSLN